MSPRVVPWYSKKELEIVANQLFSENTEDRRKGMKRVDIWKCRRRDMPRAIESTWLLVKIQIEDAEKSKGREASAERMDMQLMYSTALMRFLNFMLDARAGDRPSSTMYQQASHSGIPQWLVDVRNEIAHGQSLPSLSTLRYAAEVALKWLYDSYWREYMSSNFSNEDGNNADSSNENEDIRIFKLWLFVNDARCSGCSSFQEVCQNIDRDLLADALNFVGEDDVSNISLEKLSTTLLQRLRKALKIVLSDNFVKCVLVDDCGLLSESNICSSTGDLSGDRVKFWEPLFIAVAKTPAFVVLVEGLLKVTDCKSSSRQKIASLWLNEIMKGILEYQQSTQQIRSELGPDKSKKKKKKFNIEPNRRALLAINVKEESKINFRKWLETCFRNPNLYTPIFAISLLDIQDPPIRSDNRRLLLTLLNVYLGKQQAKRENKTGDTYTLNMLVGENDVEIETSDELERNVSNIADDVSSDWVLCKDNEKWKTCPLGMLPEKSEWCVL